MSDNSEQLAEGTLISHLLELRDRLLRALIAVLTDLRDAGNTVLVVEHNLDVIKTADWVIDLGPEGGDGGGRIVAEGPPGEIIEKAARSHTARILGEFLRERGR